jgi:hypothetical protein
LPRQPLADCSCILPDTNGFVNTFLKENLHFLQAKAKRPLHRKTSVARAAAYRCALQKPPCARLKKYFGRKPANSTQQPCSALQKMLYLH